MTDLGVYALAEMLNRKDNDPNAELRLRRGVVTVANHITGLYTVTIGGASIPLMPSVRHVQPDVGDTVEVLFDGPSTRIVGVVSPLVWHYVGAAGEPAFTNSWVASNGLTTLSLVQSEGSVRFAKDAQGFVHLEGMVASGVVGTSCFTLPAGFIPEQRSNFPALSNSAFGVIIVVGKYNSDTPGRVICFTGSNVYFQLSGITFYAG
jgi:hypothetical protein